MENTPLNNDQLLVEVINKFRKFLVEDLGLDNQEIQ